MNILNTITTLLFVIAFGAFQAQAQTGSDELMMVDGKQLKGKIISTKGADVTFTMFAHGDTLISIISKKDIKSIHFADGKTVQMSMGSIEPNAQTWAEKVKACNNKVAVLPFAYVDTYTPPEEQKGTINAQVDCINDIKAVNKVLMIQNPDTTNAILARNNVNWENVKHYVPAELASMLNVQFVVLGTVEIAPVLNPKDQDENSFGIENQTLNNPEGNRDGSSIDPKKFTTIVDVNIYDILGETYYTNEQQSYWQTPLSYTKNLTYLIGESPFNTTKK